MDAKQSELVFVYKGHATTVLTGTYSLMQWYKSKLKQEPQYRSGLLQVRKLGAKQFQPILKK